MCMYGLYVVTIVMADLCHSECVNISSVRIQMFNVSDIGEFMTPLQPQQVCWISQAACCMYTNLYLYPAFWNFVLRHIVASLFRLRQYVPIFWCRCRNRPL